jgi:type I restriction enzyme, S subunit
MNKAAGMNAGWQTRKLGEVAEVFDGPHATSKTVGAGPICLGMSALQGGTINLGETRHVTTDDFRRWTRRVKPRTDDVVFSYETKLDEAAIIPERLECRHGRRMGLVRLNRSHVVPRVFLYQYISPAFLEFLGSRTIRGAIVDRISIREFPSFPIAIPPLPEQQRIVAILDEAFDGIATAKANTEKNLQNARAVFESHLQAVFTKLRLNSPLTRISHRPIGKRPSFMA